MEKQNTVLIFGSGQDSYYLSKLYLDLGWRVITTVRRHSVSECQSPRIDELNGPCTVYCDITDRASVDNAFEFASPTHCFLTAAMSHVWVGQKIPYYTLSTNTLGTLNVLESFKKINPSGKLHFCGSSEQFGNSFIEKDGIKYQNEDTPMWPCSIYGVSKLAAFHLCRHYREAFNLFISTTRLFNHESPQRSANFVTMKIIRGALEIKHGLRQSLEMGRLNSIRDWSHASDFADLMYQIISLDKPTDYVCGSGEGHSIEEFCKIVFEKLGMNYKDYVTYNSQYERSVELEYLRCDNSKIKKELNWKPKYSFEGLIDDMMKSEEKKFK